MSTRDGGSRFDPDEQAQTGDQFAPDAIETTIATRMLPGAQNDDEARLVRALIEAYTLPLTVEAAITRVQGAVQQSGTVRRTATNTMDAEAPTIPGGRPPASARRPRLTPRQTLMSSAVAVLLLAMLVGAFYAIPSLRGGETGPIGQLTVTPTVTPVTPTSTPTATPLPAGVITEYHVPTANAGPLAITAGHDGAVWFIEGNTSKIGRITPDGHITEYTVQTNHAYALAAITSGPDGAVWFTESPMTIGREAGTTGKIGRITPDGHITEYPIALLNSDPVGIAAGSDGNLWFSDPVGDRIVRMTPNGEFTGFTLPGAQNPLITPANGVFYCGCATGIASGPDGALWFVENGGNKIGRISVSGHITEYPIPTANSNSRFITAGPDGAMWFTEGLNGVRIRQIGRISMDGRITEFPLPTQESDVPASITAGPDGAVWFTLAPDYTGSNIPSGANKIGRMAPDGHVTEYPILAPEGDLLAGDITAGPDGALWFTEYRAAKIGRITA